MRAIVALFASGCSIATVAPIRSTPSTPPAEAAQEAATCPEHSSATTIDYLIGGAFVLAGSIAYAASQDERDCNFLGTGCETYTKDEGLMYAGVGLILAGLPWGISGVVGTSRLRDCSKLRAQYPPLVPGTVLPVPR